MRWSSRLGGRNVTDSGGKIRKFAGRARRGLSLPEHDWRDVNRRTSRRGAHQRWQQFRGRWDGRPPRRPSTHGGARQRGAWDGRHERKKEPTPSRIADGRTVTAREMTAATLPGIARCRLAAPAAGSSSRLTSPAAAGEVGHAALLTAGSANLADAARGPVGAQGRAEASVDVTATGAPLAPAATSAPVAHLVEEEDLAAGDEPARSVHPPSSFPLSSHPRSPLRLGPAPRRRAVRPLSSRAFGLSSGHVRPVSRLARPAHVRR